jgi:hypothetical protein
MEDFHKHGERLAYGYLLSFQRTGWLSLLNFNLYHNYNTALSKSQELFFYKIQESSLNIIPDSPSFKYPYLYYLRINITIIYRLIGNR